MRELYSHLYTLSATSVSVCVFRWSSFGCACVRGYCCSGGRFLSVVFGPKISSSTVTFSPSQDLLCLTTVVWGSSSADDRRPSSEGCMWARRRVTGPGWEMAADTGVMEPKGHEETHMDGKTSGRVMEDNQRTEQLHWVAFPSLSCSLALSLCISLLHSWLCLLLTNCLCFLFFTFPRSLSLSLCCSLYCSVGFRQCCPFPSLTLWWRDGLWSEKAMKRWRPSTQRNTLLSLFWYFCNPKTVMQIILYCLSVNLQNITADVFMVPLLVTREIEMDLIAFALVVVSLEFKRILFVVVTAMKCLTKNNV